MRSLLFVLMVLFCVKSFGQPTFTNAFHFNVGQSIQASLFEDHTLTPGPAGSNQTWNFSTVPDSLTPFFADVVAPSATPYAASFPGANAVFRFGSDSVTLYRFYKNTVSLSEDLGYIVNSPQIPFPINETFTDTRMEAKFPMVLNESFSDTYASISYFQIGTDTLSKTHVIGNYSMKYDAYGTITTPAGTFSNAIRMKVRDERKDSTVSLLFPGPPTISSTINTVYLWFVSQGSSFPVRFQLEYDSIFDGETLNVSNYGYFTNPTTGNPTLTRTRKIQVFPNPSTDYLHLLHPEGEEATHITISSPTGKTYETEKKNNLIDISNLPAGIYFLKANYHGENHQIRFLKK